MSMTPITNGWSYSPPRPSTTGGLEKRKHTVALKDYEASRGKVAAIQSRLNRTIESIRENPAYSDPGRRAEMARATL